MKVNINDLKIIINKLILETEKIFNKENFIESEIDYYWSIDTEDWDKYNESPTLVMGSLDDDWLELLKQVEDNGIFTSTDFERLGNIIRYLGYKKYND